MVAPAMKSRLCYIAVVVTISLLTQILYLVFK